jgi:TRAP-type C4-dicarboxylate transport system permease small subunit
VVRLYDGLIDALAYIAVALLLAIMVGIGVDVAARYFFNQPIGWMLEFVQHSLLCILFLGMAWLTREGGHVSIDMLVEALPVRQRRALVVFGLLVAGATSAFVAYWSLVTTIDNYRRGVETSGIYPIPRSLLTGTIALGLALTAIEFFRRANKIFHSSDDEIMRRHTEEIEP